MLSVRLLHICRRQLFVATAITYKAKYTFMKMDSQSGMFKMSLAIFVTIHCYASYRHDKLLVSPSNPSIISVAMVVANYIHTLRFDGKVVANNWHA